MKTLTEMIEEWKRQGIELYVEGDTLKYRAAKGRMTPELKREIAGSREELIRLLSESHSPGDPAPPEPAAGQADVPPIPLAPEMDDYPLSPAQFRLWTLQRMEGPSAAYHIRLPLMVKGPLDGQALSRALRYLVERHESLRTRFVAREDASPRQVIDTAERFRMTAEDRSDRPPDRGELEEWIRDYTTRPFDLEEGLPFRAHLIKLSGRKHLLTLVMHHIVSDGWSLSVLARELQECYGQIRAGASPDLPRLPVRYRDYACWQQERLEAPPMKRARNYWLETLADPPQLDLPTDRPRPPTQSHRGETLFFSFSAERSDTLRALAADRRCSLFMLLTSLVFLLLHKHTGQEELIAGTPSSGRSHPDLEGQIGFYLNMLALRTAVNPEQSCEELLEQVKRDLLEAYDHRDYPFDRIIGELDLPRDPSRTPLFDVMIFMQNAGSLEMRLDEARIEPVIVDSGTAKTDLVFDFSEEEEEIAFSINYSTDLFLQGTIERMAARLKTLARAVTGDPGKTVGGISCLSEEDRLLLRSVNGTDRRGPAPGHLGERFRRQAAQTPGRTAVTDGKGNRLTYRELHERALRLARHLRRQGVDPGERVAVAMEPQADLPACLLGIALAGAGWLALDPRFPAERSAYMMEDAGCVRVLARSDGALPPGVDPGRYEVIHTDNLPASGAGTELPEPEAGRLAYVIYTSGSTGKPKGVSVAHRSLDNFLAGMQDLLEMKEGDAMPLLTTVTFDIALLELFLPLTTGGSVHLPERDVAEDGFRLASLLDRKSFTHVQATPATWRMLEETEWEGDDRLTILSGGEALTPELAGALLPRCRRLWNLYGPTETTIWSTARRVTRDSLEQQNEYVSIGRPIRNTRVHVLDPRRRPVPPGVTGELWIGGDGVATGYHGRAGLTRRNFVRLPHLENAEGRLYRTGDLVRLQPDGELTFLGRMDRQVKVRGHRIEPGEIESRLLEREEVSAAAVLAVPDTTGVQELLAWWTGAGEGGATGAEPGLRRHLRQYLPDYMIPGRFIRLEEMPLTLNGKIDRRALEERRPDSSSAPQASEPPSGPAEERLAGLWEELLELEGGAVGRESRFFRLGGHSLKAIRLANRVRREFGVSIDAMEIFRHPELSEMARLIEGRREKKGGEQEADDELSESEKSALRNFQDNNQE